MSIESLAIALHHSRAVGTAKLVLIGIANHDGDGGAWPSVSTLAKYAGIDPRSVQRAVKKLEELHEVRRMIQAGGTAETANHERPNRYLFTLRCPHDCDRSSQHRTTFAPITELDIDGLSTRVTPASPGDTSVTPRVTPASPKPSLNHPYTAEKKTHVGNRARANAGACGHALIDPRHCERGCAPGDVTGEAA